jgi:hypothetical protein
VTKSKEESFQARHNSSCLESQLLERWRGKKKREKRRRRERRGKERRRRASREGRGERRERKRERVLNRVL